ncbi:MAG: hypothetical protein EAZ76_11990 [Nostocales cyanobacterium]|nr:MAG: hypothetical protein EAZ87_07110 [Nostocales cyanobacterium]TAF13335.1 MAG: hypothetical protein EAZ76_11990 [Nostocales cyanobacterium]
MKVFSPITFLAILTTLGIANLPQDIQAKNTQDTLFSQHISSSPKPTTTPTPTPTKPPTR